MQEKKMKEFLDENKIKYVSVRHSTAYTAQEVAALTHTKGKDFAKTVMVMLDGALAIVLMFTVAIRSRLLSVTASQ